MQNDNTHTCDCIGTDAEDVFCVAADAMDRSIAEMIKAEQEFIAYLVSKYGPSENID
jgi:hypothetical protein